MTEVENSPPHNSVIFLGPETGEHTQLIYNTRNIVLNKMNTVHFNFSTLLEN